MALSRKARTALITVILVIVALVALAAVLLSCVHVKTVLQGDEEITLTNREEYVEPGVYAEFSMPFGLGTSTLQNCDVDIAGEVDDTKPGDYELTYTASFCMWRGSATRTVHVVDTAAPVITLEGSATAMASSAEAYVEQGYTATDDYDGDITDKVERTVGDGLITYKVADSSGNETTVTRTITASEPTSKVVYLTFDDGPGAYTEQLLAVLAKHNVKATFFVTANGDTSLIAKEAAAGHSIGVHSASHNYNKIYASEDAFMADFEQMESIIQQQTGSRTTLFRFPGGSSNTVSSFNPGIMTKLTTNMTAKGYQYFDWNVSSGDAGATTSTDQVYQNVIDGIQAHDVSVVLQHDIKDFSVAAVDRILTWGEQNGYTFLPLTAASPGAHHGVNN